VQNKVAVGEKVELLFLAFAFASLVRGGSNFVAKFLLPVPEYQRSRGFGRDERGGVSDRVLMPVEESASKFPIKCVKFFLSL